MKNNEVIKPKISDKIYNRLTKSAKANKLKIGDFIYTICLTELRKTKHNHFYYPKNQTPIRQVRFSEQQVCDLKKISDEADVPLTILIHTLLEFNEANII